MVIAELTLAFVGCLKLELWKWRSSSCPWARVGKGQPLPDLPGQ